MHISRLINTIREYIENQKKVEHVEIWQRVSNPRTLNRKVTALRVFCDFLINVYHDIIYLRKVMKKAPPVFNIEANFVVFDEAIPTLLDMGLIGKSDRRTRRPTQLQLDKLKVGQLTLCINCPYL